MQGIDETNKSIPYIRGRHIGVSFKKNDLKADWFRNLVLIVIS